MHTRNYWFSLYWKWYGQKWAYTNSVRNNTSVHRTKNSLVCVWPDDDVVFLRSVHDQMSCIRIRKINRKTLNWTYPKQICITMDHEIGFIGVTFIWRTFISMANFMLLFIVLDELQQFVSSWTISHGPFNHIHTYTLPLPNPIEFLC